MRLGFYTEFNSGLDFDEIVESGTILYTNKATDDSELVNVEQYATIEFEVIAEHSEDENASATYIKNHRNLGTIIRELELGFLALILTKENAAKSYRNLCTL